MRRLNLPIGIQDFGSIRSEDYYYVDKTDLLYQLIEQGKYYFLARPRRFGKTLLIETIRELFQCEESLFRGLAIHDHWDWASPHPVIRLSFGADYNTPGALEADIFKQLELIEIAYGVEAKTASGPGRLRNLIYQLHKTTQKSVVILVDDYDNPILDAIGNLQLAKSNRDYLRGFYGVIKDQSRVVRFVLLAGVTMFSTGSPFSGLNNLEDISLAPQFASLCGFTEQELEAVFSSELLGLDRSDIRRWYNGYNFLGSEKVYNPIDILHLLRYRVFKDWWFKLGTPKYLYQTLVDQSINLFELETLEIDERQLMQFDVDEVDLRVLLFQSGYLTIAKQRAENGTSSFRLAFPNEAVRRAFNTDLLHYLGKN